MSKIGQPGSNFSSEIDMVYRLTGCLTILMLSIDALNPIKQVSNIIIINIIIIINVIIIIVM